MTPDQTNDAWYLERNNQRFGPLSEEEMRTYFRAGMVRAGDTIVMPRELGSLSAEAAAALLGMAAPSEGSGALPARRPTVGRQPQPNEVGWLFRIGGVVAVIGLLYFTLHEPLQRPPEPAAIVVASAAPLAPVAAMPPLAESLGAPGDSPAPTPPPEREQPSAVVDPAQSIRAATVSAATDVGNRARSVETDPWFERATILALAEDWSGMLAHASGWTVNQPKRDLAWWYLGLANAQLGSMAEAESAFKQALVISPRFFQGRWSLANVYLVTNRTPDARRILQELAHEQPGNAAVWNDLGVAMDNSGEFDEAVAAYQKSVQLKPDYRLAWTNLAKCYSHFGYKDRSKAAALKAESL